MKIESCSLTPFRIPFRRPLEIAGARVEARLGWLIELHAEAGSIGLGEVSPHPAAPDAAVARVADGIERAGSILIGLDARDLAGAVRRLAAIGPPPLRAGLETAVYDLAARARGASVAELLGGARRRRVAVNALLGEPDPAALRSEARAAVARGFRCLKLKLPPHDVDGAVARVAAVRAGAGDDVAIRADANAGWTVAEAIDAMRRLTSYGIEYVEQPAASLSGLAAVRRAVAVPVAADESAEDAGAVRDIAAAGAADFVVVKPAAVGLTGAFDIIRAAHRHGLGAVVTASLDTGVGIAAALHLAATLADPAPACGLATEDLLAGDLIRERPVLTAGELEVPAGPGLGVRLDRRALDRWSHPAPSITERVGHAR
jgi:o-succinylbenzoate synthase